MINGSHGLHIRRLLHHPSSSALYFSTFFLVLALPASASPAGFWDKIYYAPTPSPEDGPPASANASRDKRLLPYQICGVLGGYLAFVLISLLLLLTVGRRLRRGAEMSPASLEMELMGGNIPSGAPLSPASTTRSWFKGPFKRSSSVKSGSVPGSVPGSAPNSPGFSSVHSFDQSVLENDKEARQREMERLYAAVMEHDAAKVQKSSPVSNTEEDDEIDDEIQQEYQSASRDKTEKRPARLLMKGQDADYPGPATPVKAIYPPSSPRFNDTASSGSQPTQRAQVGLLTSPRNVPLPMSPNRPSVSSPRSILSFGSGSKARKALKNIRISGPIRDYPGVSENDEGRAPLSPRLYPNPGPPPPPPHKLSATPQSSTTSTPRYNPVIEVEYADEALDKPQPLPMPRTNFSRGPLSPGFQPSSVQQSASANASLPLRSYNTDVTANSSLPLRSYNVDTTVPPTPTKVTYLERKRDQLNMMTPRTGVPSTPYSPYMPFTPITPVTPHLTTKKEMKSKKKVEGRRILSDEDLVLSDKEMWY